MLETIEGINEVTVQYDDSDDREYSGGDRACTSRGNLVTVTFEDVSSEFVGDDGDLPPMQLNALNAPLDPRTYIPSGDGTFLTASLSKSTVSLTPTAIEHTKGVDYADRVAKYVNGSGTDTLTFAYTVQQGDESGDLEALEILDHPKQYKGKQFGKVYRMPSTFTSRNATVNPYTHPDAEDVKASVLANTLSFPTNGQRARYMESKGSSLSYNNEIVIDTRAPTIVTVQPTPGVQSSQGTFGVGEVRSCAGWKMRRVCSVPLSAAIAAYVELVSALSLLRISN